MRADGFGVWSILFLVSLSNLAVAYPLSSPSTYTNGSSLLDASNDDFDIWIARGWDLVRATFISHNPEPYFITMVKQRNPYNLIASIYFTYDNTADETGVIHFTGSHWLEPHGHLKRSTFINIQPFDWDNKPMCVDDAIDEVRGQTWLDPLVREMNFDDLTVKVSYGDEGLTNGLLIYRFERRGVYVVFVEMVSRRVVLGRVFGEGGALNANMSSGGECEGVAVSCSGHLDVIA